MVDVSIIIPTHNRLWSLPQAIESCRQTQLFFEIIVVDDGSTDGTADWLMQQLDIICFQTHNFGKDWAVNKALEKASGKYVRFLDADDWLPPQCTDYLFHKAEEYNLDIVCAGHDLYDQDGNFVKKSPWVKCDDFLAQQLGECDSSHYSAYLFKREFIKHIPHRQEYGALDDRQFIIEVALKSPITGYINQSALAHRMHKKDRLQNAGGLALDAKHLAQINVYKKCFNILEQENRLIQRYKNAATHVLYELAHWIAIKHLKEAKEIYDWVYELNPNYNPKSTNLRNRFNKLIGFSLTQKLLRVARFIKYGWR